MSEEKFNEMVKMMFKSMMEVHDKGKDPLVLVKELREKFPEIFKEGAPNE